MVSIVNRCKVLHSHMQDSRTKEGKHIYYIIYIVVYSWLYKIYPSANHQPFKTEPEERFIKWISNFEKDDSRLHITPQ
jgi:hypothetical protein